MTLPDENLILLVQVLPVISFTYLSYLTCRIVYSILGLIQALRFMMTLFDENLILLVQVLIFDLSYLQCTVM